MESRIKMLREKRGLIQELLAVEIGVTQQMLSKYEKKLQSAKALASASLKIGKVSADSACAYIFHQPKMPKELKALKEK